MPPTADRMNLRKKQNAQRHHQEGHEFQNRVDALVQVGHGFLVYLGPCGKFGRVTVLSYGGDFHQRHAGDGGGSRENIAAFALAYGP